MSKRNFILLIIVLIIAIIGVFGFLYLRPGTNAPVGDNSGTNFVAPFNSFGNSKPTSPVTKTPVNVSTGTSLPATETPVMKLTKISSMPIAGFTVFSKERLKDVPVPAPTSGGVGVPTANVGIVTKKTTTKPTPPPTEFAPALRYVDTATGNIYETFADKINEQKFSTTIIPKVYDSYFSNNGESVVMRYLKSDDKTIETFVGVLPKELLGGDTTGNNEIKGSFLPDDVKDISVSPDNSKIFYLFESANGSDNSMIGVTLNLLNNKKVQIFDSPFTEWLSQWPMNNAITLSTKPSANIPGYMYNMDGAGKNLSQVLGNVNGLTTLTSPNGKLILYGDNNLSLYIYHTDTRNSDVLGIKTLPEKCVWGNASDTIYCAVPKSVDAGGYPDTWYQGEVSFNDQIWKIDVKTGNATLIIDPTTVGSGEEVDGIKLSLDAGENYLFFVNKKDSFLWKLSLK